MGKVRNEYLILDIDKFNISEYADWGKITKFSYLSKDYRSDYLPYYETRGISRDDLINERYSKFYTKDFIPREYLEDNEDVIIQMPIMLYINEIYRADFTSKQFDIMMDEGFELDETFAYNLIQRFGGVLEPQEKTIMQESIDIDWNARVSEIYIDQWHSGEAVSSTWYMTPGIRTEEGFKMDQRAYEYSQPELNFWNMIMSFEVLNEDGVQVYDSSVNDFYYTDFKEMDSAAEWTIKEFDRAERKLEDEEDDYLAKTYSYTITAYDKVVHPVYIIDSFVYENSHYKKNECECVNWGFESYWDVEKIVRDNKE